MNTNTIMANLINNAFSQDDIKKVCGMYTPGMEFEVRFGQMEHGVNRYNKQSRSAFVPNVHYSLYTYVYNQLAASHEFTATPIDIRYKYFKCDVYPDGVRYVDNGTENWYETKSRVHILDGKCPVLCTALPHVRVALSRETRVYPTTERFDLTCARHKRGTRFVFNDGELIIELFREDTAGQFQIELEFSGNAIDSEHVFRSINFILHMVRDAANIIRHFNSTLGSFNVMTDLAWFVNKPRNLTRTSDCSSQTHVWMPKLNGERRLLFVQNGTLIHMFDEKGSFYSMPKLDTPLFNGTNVIIDGEFYKNQFYALDIMIYENMDVRSEGFLTRQELMKKCIQILRKHTHVPDVFQQIPSFECCPTTHAMFKQVMQNVNVYDGIIFKPKHEPYRNMVTYKYKPVHLNTIDVLVDAHTMHAMCGDFNNKFIHVSTIIDKRVHFNMDEKTLKNFTGRIVEVQIQTIEHDHVVLNIVRCRNDKVRPNFRTIVRDIYQDICNPREDIDQLFIH